MLPFRERKEEKNMKWVVYHSVIITNRSIDHRPLHKIVNLLSYISEVRVYYILHFINELCANSKDFFKHLQDIEK